MTSIIPNLNDADLLHDIVQEVKKVDGIWGIVLGGSRATGMHHSKSDYDLGLFFRGEQGFDLAALNRVASALDDAHRENLVTPIGGWGPWVVGGGWLTIRSTPVDFTYRDIDRVARVVADCCRGKVEIAYQGAYTVGFVTTTYMAEIDACKVLWDLSGRIAAIKKLAQPYPRELKSAMIECYAWMPPFAVFSGRKCIARSDVAFASSCCYWATAAMCQMLFARNERYCLNEKGAVEVVETFPIKPAGFKSRIEEMFSVLGADGAAIGRSFEILNSLADDVAKLCGTSNRVG